jgi:hypothetical protein
MIKDVEELIKESEKILPSEDLLIEAVRDIMKEEIKEYIREKMEENPKIKEEIREAMLVYINAKVKEVEAATLMTKALGELGIISLPPETKKELISNIYKIFQKEIDEMLEKTL